MSVSARTPRDLIWEEQERRGEMSVGDVDMQHVGMPLDARDVVRQPDQVGRPQRELAEEPALGSWSSLSRAVRVIGVSGQSIVSRKARSAARNSCR